MNSETCDPLFASAPPELSVQQRNEINQYIANHPEIKTIIQDLMTAIATSKPEKPLDFAREYFSNMKNSPQ